MSIRNEGYTPTKKLDTSRPPKGASAFMIQKNRERKIVDYVIAERKSIDDLASCVKFCIEAGWQPIGSVFAIQSGSYTYFYQSLVKYSCD